MKYFIFLIFFHLIKLPTSGQCVDSLVGDWKVFACFNGEVYFNLKNDSTFLTVEIKEMYPDTLAQKNFIQLAKTLYGSMLYHFEKNGTFTLTMDSLFNITGQYCFIPSKQILQITTKNSLNTDVTDNATAKLDKGFLYLSRKWDDDRMIDMVLEKISK